ncbi:major capsid protein [Hydrogenophaga sp. ANAO-22]|uniref:major capsid protein n=1 Tax=Hydrogenophaga sp. ANAO-22 TaxID=3166645 RepID=UPI0036D3B951
MLTFRQKLRYGAAVALVGASTAAMAEVPAGVLTSLTTASADIATLGAAVFAVIVGIAIWKWFRRTM